MSREDTALLLVDVQERLVPAIADHRPLLARCRLLLEAARELEIPILATEQYPQGLGPTVPELAELLEAPVAKVSFSCCGEPAVLDWLDDSDVGKVLLAGIECHVCIQQTALDLLANGYEVYVAADAVGSRRPDDKRWALDRLARCDVVVTTSESAVFEWTQVAGTPEFKRISRRIKAADARLGAVE